MSADEKNVEEAESSEVQPTSEEAAAEGSEVKAGSKETAASSEVQPTSEEDAAVVASEVESGSKETAASSSEAGSTTGSGVDGAEGEEAPKRTRRRRGAKAEAEAAKEPKAKKPAAKKPASKKPDAKKPETKKPETHTRRSRSARKPSEPLPVVRAQARYVRSSARKARLVCDHIRGRSVPDARAILAHTTRAVARDWSKLLESAVANAEHNHELLGDDLYIKDVRADEGPTIKRFQPRARGRANRIRKRTSHLTILLTSKD